MNAEFLQRLQDPPKPYRPIPFWSWNERLDTAETRRQIAEMDRVGLGGYFMHARGGLQTPYLSEAWFAEIAAGVDEARARGMGAWAYDENGWPSGFGDGRVNGRGERYCQKYLRFEPVDDEAERADGRTIGHARGEGGRLLRFYYDVNPYYVDAMDPEVTRAFLEEAYAPYAARFAEAFGGPLPGFFTDEPQLSRAGIPWSLTLPERYREAYGEDLLPLLPQIFFPLPGYQRTRYRFWHLVQELFVTHYTQQLYDWCTAHGALLTGHMVLEETLLSQLTSNAAVMPHYEFFHMPGMDWLLRHIEPPTTALQVTSVAHQLGQRQILSESFAGTGWGVTLEELKWIYEWQMTRGITTLCQHLQGYSLRGVRKRDWPPSLFYQQPWWPKYRLFNDAMTRVGMLLAEGEVRFETLVLHPQSSAWLCFDNAANDGLDALQAGLLDLTRALEAEHVPLHYGDERILARHGRVEGDALVVGAQRYRVVLVPPCVTLASRTLELLRAYASGGGRLLWVGQGPTLVEGAEDERLAELLAQGERVADAQEAARAVAEAGRAISVADAEGREIADVTATVRWLAPDLAGTACRFYFLANHSQETDYAALLRMRGAAAAWLETETGTLRRLRARRRGPYLELSHTFPRMGSLALLVADSAHAFDDLPAAPEPAEGPALSPALLAGDWSLELLDPNALTLDYCTFWFDGVLQAEHEHVSAIQPLALALERPVEIRMEFPVEVAAGFTPGEDTCLVLETPERYTLQINGQPVEVRDAGPYRDRAFRQVPVGGLLRPGANTITLTTTFQQSPEIYAHLRRAQVHEAEKNNLTFDSEIEAAYLIGRFAVQTPGAWEPLPRNASRYRGPFVLAPLSERVLLGDLVPQGLPFFSGTARLTTTLSLRADEARAQTFVFSEKMCNNVALAVNGEPVREWFWRPYVANLTGRLRAGENTVTLELTSGLRNLLGPHHQAEGETYRTVPATFYKTPNVWGTKEWDDGYCFVEFGLRL